MSARANQSWQCFVEISLGIICDGLGGLCFQIRLFLFFLDNQLCLLCNFLNKDIENTDL